MASSSSSAYNTFQSSKAGRGPGPSDLEATGESQDLLRDVDEYRSKLEKASFYALEAFDGIKRQGVQDTPSARVAFRNHRRWFWIAQLSAWLLVALTYFERPLWCNNADMRKNVDAPCRNIMYPSYEIDSVPPRHNIELEVILLMAIMVDLVLLARAQGPNVMRGQAGPRIVVLVLYVCDTLLSLHYEPGSFRMCPYLRMAMAMFYSNDVLRKFVLILQSAPAVLNVFILGFALMAFFASAGTTLFKETQEGKEYFPDFVAGLRSLFKLITLGNFPGIMLPGYTDSRPVGVFFIVYVMVMVFFLLPMLTAVIYNQYTENVDAIIAAKNQVQTESEDLAFEALQSDGEVPIAMVEDLCSEVVVVLNIRTANSTSVNRKRAAFADKDGDGFISRSEFHALLGDFRKQRIDDAAVVPEVERMFPFVATSPMWQGLKDFITSRKWEAILMTAFSVTVLHGAISTNVDFAYDIVFSCVFSIECILKILVLGWHEYFSRSENNFDFWITVVTAFATLSTFLPGLSASPSVVRTLSTFRLLRLMRLLNWIPGFDVLLRAFGHALPEIGSIAKVLYCAMFIFGVAGCQLFGGYINTDPRSSQKAILEASEFGQGGYYALSFNDLPSAFVTLFALLGQNDMFVVIDAYTKVRGNWAWIYFVAWWIFGVVICLNIVVSFIIDSFVSEFQKAKTLKSQTDD
mmetsp:Transcript_125958/g.327114  ORF Transcript_125958/g.327114 Transcript_125958/m.327114 type:complete len:690 (-) Transcript_125958:28-2097(-)